MYTLSGQALDSFTTRPSTVFRNQAFCKPPSVSFLVASLLRPLLSGQAEVGAVDNVMFFPVGLAPAFFRGFETHEMLPRRDFTPFRHFDEYRC